MTPVEPKERHANARAIVFAKDQPQYDPLPAMVDPDGLVLTEWELSAEDLARLMNGGRVRLWIYTFNQRLQPVALETIE